MCCTITCLEDCTSLDMQKNSMLSSLKHNGAGTQKSMCNMLPHPTAARHAARSDKLACYVGKRRFVKLCMIARSLYKHVTMTNERIRLNVATQYVSTHPPSLLSSCKYRPVA